MRLTTAPADTTSTTSRDYLRSQPPSWASLQTALALLAVLLIVRSIVRRGYSWFTQRDRLQRPTRPAAGLPDQQTYQPCAQQQQQPPWAMGDEKAAARGKGIIGGIKGHHVRFDEEEPMGKKKTTLAIDPAWKNTTFAAGDTVPEPFMSRPPPAPPLTPPELSTAVFTFLDRPHSSQDSFIHQPNPDYTSSSTSTASLSQSSSASPSTPRRRSYNKTLPIGIPVPQRLSAASDAESADLTLSPSSYPPTSPILPPAPPGLQVQDSEDDGQAREIDVKGEIIGVLDRDGAGWTRHTRVYGGGVCLACAASGGNHHEGGFYGATVRPEEMR